MSSIVTQYLLDTQPGLYKIIAATTGTDTTRYVHGLMGIHAQENPNGAWRWMVQDGLGSVRGVVDSNLDVLESRQYAPYGEVWQQTGAEQTPLNFTGETFDENELLFLRARYYDPALAIFTSLDPLETANRYGYVSGNPINLADPSGFVCRSPISGIYNSSNSLFSSYSNFNAPLYGATPIIRLGGGIDNNISGAPYQEQDNCTKEIRGGDYGDTHYGYSISDAWVKGLSCNSLSDPEAKQMCQTLKVSLNICFQNTFNPTTGENLSSWSDDKIKTVYNSILMQAYSIYCATHDCQGTTPSISSFSTYIGDFKRVFSPIAQWDLLLNHAFYQRRNLNNPSQPIEDRYVPAQTVYASGGGNALIVFYNSANVTWGRNYGTVFGESLVAHEMGHAFALANSTNVLSIGTELTLAQYALNYYADKNGINNYGEFFGDSELERSFITKDTWDWIGQQLPMFSGGDPRGQDTSGNVNTGRNWSRNNLDIGYMLEEFIAEAYAAWALGYLAQPNIPDPFMIRNHFTRIIEAKV